MASPQLNQLFDAALDFAQLMLVEHDEFHPFGVSMAPDGSIAMVAGYTGSEHPPAQQIIALLQDAFRDQAKEGSINAAGICLDVRVLPPDHNEKTDAICVRLANVSGEAVEVFVPYHKPPIGKHVYGASFATQAQAFVLDGF